MNMRLAATSLVLAIILGGCSARRVKVAKVPRIGSHETGEASWYGIPYHGRRSANGEVYDMEKLTAAHQTYAFDTWLRVKNLSNDKTVVVRVTDRGPFAHHRIIDLSRAAAREIDMLRAGVTKVQLEVITPPSRPPVPTPIMIPSVPAPATVPPVVPVVPPTPANEEVIDPTLIYPERSALPSSSTPSIPVPTSMTTLPRQDRYTLQVGAYRDEINAQERETVMKKYASSLTIAFDEKTSMWKVFAGSFRNLDEAKGFASILRNEGVESFVVDLGLPR